MLVFLRLLILCLGLKTAYLEPPLAKRSEESMMINDSSKVKGAETQRSSKRELCRGVLFAKKV